MFGIVQEGMEMSVVSGLLQVAVKWGEQLFKEVVSRTGLWQAMQTLDKKAP